MENQKVVDLLRSVANLIESQVEDNTKEVFSMVGVKALDKDDKKSQLPESIKEAMLKAKDISEAKNAFGEGINPEIWEKMTKPPTLDNEGVQRTLDIMKRVDANDKVRAYKTKMSNQNTKIEDYLKKIDELRMEAIIGLHDASVEIENHNTEETVSS